MAKVIDRLGLAPRLFLGSVYCVIYLECFARGCEDKMLLMEKWCRVPLEAVLWRIYVRFYAVQLFDLAEAWNQL